MIVKIMIKMIADVTIKKIIVAVIANSICGIKKGIVRAKLFFARAIFLFKEIYLCAKFI